MHSRILPLLALLFALTVAVPAATYTVTTNNNAGAGSLRDAINLANANAGADTIDFDTAGTFSTPQTITLTSGQLVITGPVTMDAPSAAAKRVTIDANDGSRVMRVELTGSGTVTLRHLTLQRGNTTDDGGGIQMASAAGSTLELVDCVVWTCIAHDGGGIYAGAGTSMIINCTVAENTADSDNAGALGNGGGFRRNGGIANVGNTIIAKNTDASVATEHPDVSGAFISLGHNLIGKSNGLDTGSGTPFQNGVNGDQTVTIYDNEYTVTSSANSGAGTLREAINNANAGGGAVITMPSNANVTLNGSQLSIESEIEIIGNNSTVNAGGLSRVLSVDSAGGNAVILRNLVITGACTSLGHNLIGIATGSTGFTNGVLGDIIGASAYLGPLQNNGAPTFTHALLAGSAAMDAAATIANSTDQRGLLRNGALNDIGAYELLTESYAYWAAHTFPSATNAGINQDYDGDGKTNGFEFGAGSDPTDATSVPGVITSVTGNNATTNFITTFALSPLAPAGTTVLRYSTDLVMWQNVPGNLYQIVGADPARNIVLLRVTVPVSFAPNLFLRLERLP